MSEFCVRLENPTPGEEIIEVLENSEDFSNFTIEVIDRRYGLQFVARKKTAKRGFCLPLAKPKRENAAAFEVEPDQKYSTLSEDSALGTKSKKPVRRIFNKENVKEFEGFARELNEKLGYQVKDGKNYASIDLHTEEKYSDDFHLKGLITSKGPFNPAWE